MAKRHKLRVHLVFSIRHTDNVPFGYIQFKNKTVSPFFYSRERGKALLLKAVSTHQLTQFEGAKLAHLLTRFRSLHRLPSAETKDDGLVNH